MAGLLGLAAAFGLVLLIWWRVRSARRMEGSSRMRGAGLDIQHLAESSSSDKHLAERIDDPRLAAAGIIIAIATMDGPISQAEIERLVGNAEDTFGVNAREALELVSLGRWLAREFGTNTEAVRQLSQTVLRTAGVEAGPDLVRIAEEVAVAGDPELGPDQRAMLANLRQSFGIERAGRQRG